MATKKSTSAHAKTAKSSKTAKTTKVTASSKTNKTVKTTSPAKTQHTAKSITAKKSNKHVIAYIVGAVAAAALVIICIIALANHINNNGQNALTVKDGNGDKITTQYLGFDNFNFRLKIPTSFHALSVDAIKSKYGSNNAPRTVYANDDESVLIAISPTDSTITNDEVVTYLNTIKSVFALGADVIDDSTFTQGNHNVATMQMTTNGDNGEKLYNNLLFFAQEDKLTMVTFSCPESEQKKWEPVSKFIFKSIDFTK